eukprot:3880918-Rhodomonas_salina.1
MKTYEQRGTTEWVAPAVDIDRELLDSTAEQEEEASSSEPPSSGNTDKTEESPRVGGIRKAPESGEIGQMNIASMPFLLQGVDPLAASSSQLALMDATMMMPNSMANQAALLMQVAAMSGYLHAQQRQTGTNQVSSPMNLLTGAQGASMLGQAMLGQAMLGQATLVAQGQVLRAHEIPAQAIPVQAFAVPGQLPQPQADNRIPGLAQVLTTIMNQPHLIESSHTPQQQSESDPFMAHTPRNLRVTCPTGQAPGSSSSPAACGAAPALSPRPFPAHPQRGTAPVLCCR